MYVRLNRDFGVDEGKFWQGDNELQQLMVMTHYDDDPDSNYYVEAYVDWKSDELTTPFVAGSVIPCQLIGVSEIYAPPHVIFYADGSSSVAP